MVFFLSAFFFSSAPIFVVVLEKIVLIMNHEYSAIQPLPNDKECKRLFESLQAAI